MFMFTSMLIILDVHVIVLGIGPPYFAFIISLSFTYSSMYEKPPKSLCNVVIEYGASAIAWYSLKLVPVVYEWHNSP